MNISLICVGALVNSGDAVIAGVLDLDMYNMRGLLAESGPRHID